MAPFDAWMDVPLHKLGACRRVVVVVLPLDVRRGRLGLLTTLDQPEHLPCSLRGRRGSVARLVSSWVYHRRNLLGSTLALPVTVTVLCAARPLWHSMSP